LIIHPYWFRLLQPLVPDQQTELLVTVRVPGVVAVPALSWVTVCDCSDEVEIVRVPVRVL
jgi:hypothetical protein